MQGGNFSGHGIDGSRELKAGKNSAGSRRVGEHLYRGDSGRSVTGTFIQTHTHIHIHTHTHVLTHTRAHAFTHTYTYERTHTQVKYMMTNTHVGASPIQGKQDVATRQHRQQGAADREQRLADR
jgi:hypothetical protein